MTEYSIGYEELLDFPYEKYLEFGKIINLEAKEEKKQQEQAEKKAKKNY